MHASLKLKWKSNEWVRDDPKFKYIDKRKRDQQSICIFSASARRVAITNCSASTKCLVPISIDLYIYIYVVVSICMLFFLFCACASLAYRDDLMHFFDFCVNCTVCALTSRSASIFPLSSFGWFIFNSIFSDGFLICAHVIPHSESSLLFKK